MKSWNRAAAWAVSPLLLASLPAQDPAPTAAPGPMLTVATDHLDVLRPVLRLFAPSTTVDGRADDCHYEVTLAADGAATLAVLPGSVGILRATGDPAALMRHFASDLAMFRSIARGAFTVALTQSKMSAKEAAQFVDEAFALPEQVADLSVVVTGDLEHRENGIDVAVRITAKAGTAVDRFLQLLEPSSQGVPVLASKGWVGMQLSLEPTSLLAITESMTDWSLAFTHPDAEARARARQVTMQMARLYDGGAAVAVGANGALTMLVGMSDADASRTLFESDDYRAMLGGQQSVSRNLEIELVDRPFEHRGSKFVLLQVHNDGPPNAMMPEGTSSSYSGVAGNYMLVASTEQEVVQLADAAMDRKVRRRPLAGGTVLTMDIDLAAIVTAVAAGMPKAPPMDGLPQAVGLRLGRTGRTLEIDVHVQ